MRLLTYLLLGVSFLLAYSCGPTYVRDPNSAAILTVTYEGAWPEDNEGPDIIFYHDYEYRPQMDCTKLDEVECSRALYEKGVKIFLEAKSLEPKKLKLTATLEYNRALSHFIEAEIRLKRAKTTIYKYWKTAVLSGLNEDIVRAIRKCESKIEFLLKE